MVRLHNINVKLDLIPHTVVAATQLTIDLILGCLKIRIDLSYTIPVSRALEAGPAISSLSCAVRIGHGMHAGISGLGVYRNGQKQITVRAQLSTSPKS
jgi:hypothetical protein